MKTKLSFLIIVLMFCFCSKNTKVTETESKDISGSIKITGAYALSPLVQVWAESFMKQHPDVKIEVIPSGSGQGLEDILSGKADIGMISSEVPVEDDTLVWFAPVAKLTVVPVISKKNPDYETIMKNGITKDQLSAIYSGNTKSWAEVYKSASKNPVNVFVRSDKSGATDVFGKYLWLEKNEFKGNGVDGDVKMLEAIRNDPNSIGYLNLVYLIDTLKRNFIEGVSIVPIDLNSNGMIDPKESFYDDYEEFNRAVWIGKYPSILTRDLCLDTKGTPKNPAVIEFLKWALSYGQDTISSFGYIPQRLSVIRCRLESLEKN